MFCIRNSNKRMHLGFQIPTALQYFSPNHVECELWEKYTVVWNVYNVRQIQSSLNCCHDIDIFFNWLIMTYHNQVFTVPIFSFKLLESHNHMDLSRSANQECKEIIQKFFLGVLMPSVARLHARLRKSVLMIWKQGIWRNKMALIMWQCCKYSVPTKQHTCRKKKMRQEIVPIELQCLYVCMPSRHGKVVAVNSESW